MTILPSGFRIDRLSVTGPGKPEALLIFVEGLNIIVGASNTGKSYALKYIDYCFGAGEPPRRITEAEGYTHVSLTLFLRNTETRVDIVRALDGGDIVMRTFSDGNYIEDTVAARHSSSNEDNLSARLLGILGLSGTTIVKNKDGERRHLSYRNLAHLTLVDEHRIISDRPPHLSDVPQSHPFDAGVLRLLLTGEDFGSVIVTPEDPRPEGVQYKIDMLEEIILKIEKSLESQKLAEDRIAIAVSEIEGKIDQVFNSYQRVRNDLAGLEAARALAAKRLSETRSRLSIVGGLRSKFALLDQHYDSDLNRLATITEASDLFNRFPIQRCGVCGAPPEAQSPEHSSYALDEEALRVASEAEQKKLNILKRDLSLKLNELEEEYGSLERAAIDFKNEVERTQDAISSELQPTVVATGEELRRLSLNRDSLISALKEREQLEVLRKQRDSLKRDVEPKSSPKKQIVTKITVNEADEFTKVIQSSLKNWHYPESDRVLYSEKDQDIVIGGQARKAHGKGVKALTCAGFLYALMKYSGERGGPHPRMLVLDSPLVSYREPVQNVKEEDHERSPQGPEAGDDEDKALRAAGVKDAFYRALQTSATDCQIIILENNDPPEDIQKERVTVFTKSRSGRYGFFPVNAGSAG